MIICENLPKAIIIDVNIRIITDIKNHMYRIGMHYTGNNYMQMTRGSSLKIMDLDTNLTGTEVFNIQMFLNIA